MNNIVDPDVSKVRSGLARALWRAMRGKIEGETPEARKTAWRNEREDAMRLTNRLMRNLEREGISVTKTET